MEHGTGGLRGYRNCDEGHGHPSHACDGGTSASNDDQQLASAARLCTAPRALGRDAGTRTSRLSRVRQRTRLAACAQCRPALQVGDSVGHLAWECGRRRGHACRQADLLGAGHGLDRCGGGARPRSRAHPPGPNARPPSVGRPPQVIRRARPGGPRPATVSRAAIAGGRRGARDASRDQPVPARRLPTDSGRGGAGLDAHDERWPRARAGHAGRLDRYSGRVDVGAGAGDADVGPTRRIYIGHAARCGAAVDGEPRRPTGLEWELPAPRAAGFRSRDDHRDRQRCGRTLCVGRGTAQARTTHRAHEDPRRAAELRPANPAGCGSCAGRFSGAHDHPAVRPWRVGRRGARPGVHELLRHPD